MTIRLGYARHLPHQVPEGFPIFLTWNLKGALPKAAIEGFGQERQRPATQTPRPAETIAERQIRESKILFALTDGFLDQAVDGPMQLKDPAAAQIVDSSILFGTPERYDLFAWCVMCNHVHVLLLPRWELPKVTQGIKGYTAHQINQLQNKPGRVFWQDESYDHWSRDESETLGIIHYIENNPVAARLCERREEWPWSSARFRNGGQSGQAYAGEKRF
jgi:putative transposase